MMCPSIFNTVIGPIMRGPSSSHTAASVRIGLLGRKLLEELPVKAVFTFDPEGSLATTYRGQGSAMGLAGGLLGMDIGDADLLDAEKICSDKGIELVFEIQPFANNHPNTYKVMLQGINDSVQFTAISTGGGIIRLAEINGQTVEDDSSYIQPLMPVAVVKDRAQLPFEDISGFMKMADGKEEKLSEYGTRYESAIGDIPREKVLHLADSHLAIMHDAVIGGLSGTDYNDRILGRQSHLLEKIRQSNLVPSRMINSIIANVTAVMETKSAMGAIVAAPTAGSCGTLAGCLHAVVERVGAERKRQKEALLAAGLVGVFISQEGGFAAEEGGCQYECGAASGMTAAALVDLLGGSAQIAINASSMALQNTLGLICDPVADRVEVPCLGKNIMAALNAVAAANMSLAGFAHVIPLDQVITAMKEVGDGMSSKYCCTCKGGLSLTPAAQKLHGQLTAHNDI